MKNISTEERVESIQSLQSTISKLENALFTMTQSAASTKLVQKRLDAVSIGLAMLEHVWNHKLHPFTREEISAAYDVITGLLTSVGNSYAKSKEGSPQRTLLERRIRALELAAQAMKDFF